MHRKPKHHRLSLPARLSIAAGLLVAAIWATSRLRNPYLCLTLGSRAFHIYSAGDHCMVTVFQSRTDKTRFACGREEDDPLCHFSAIRIPGPNNTAISTSWSRAWWPLHLQQG